MTPRVWVERPITSVEDAVGLPVGAVAVAILDDGRVADAAVRRDDLVEPWEAGAEAGRSYTHAQMVGFTALVPVEAEEETLAGYAVGQRPGMVRRLVSATLSTVADDLRAEGAREALTPLADAAAHTPGGVAFDLRTRQFRDEYYPAPYKEGER